MEGLAPSLEICIETRFALEVGESLKSFLKRKAAQNKSDFKTDLIKLLYHFENGGAAHTIQYQSKSMYRLGLLRVLYAGLAGEPIVQRLRELEIEIKLACDEEVDQFVSSLPLKGLLPILLIQFPAFLLLLFGPLIKEFIEGLT